MSQLQSNYTWSDFTASSNGTAIDFRGFGVENSFYIESGAASSGVVSIETSRNQTGPWALIASTTMASTGTAVVMEVTGPLLWVRPRMNSTGTWTVQAVTFG